MQNDLNISALDRAISGIETQPHESLRMLRELGGSDSEQDVIESATFSALRRLNRDHEAIRHIDNAICLAPEHSDHHYNRGVLLRDIGRVSEAEAAFREAIRLDPENLDAWINLANILSDRRELGEALALLDVVVSRRPGDLNAQNNRLNTLSSLGRGEEACLGFAKLVAEHPDNETIRLNFASALHQAGRIEEARRWIQVRQANGPDMRSARLHSAKLLHALGFPDASLSMIQSLVDDAPHDEESLASLCLAWRAFDPQAPEASAAFARIERLPGRSHRSESMISQWKLLNGQFLDGFRAYESRWFAANGPRASYFGSAPRWNGSDSLSGSTIVIHCEQGAGDSIQFSRYLRLLKSSGARIILLAPESLKKIFESSAVAELVLGSDDPLPSHDYHCPLLSLPYSFKTTLETIPALTPYLRVSEGDKNAWSERLGPRRSLRIGLAWSGRRENPRDEARSLEFLRFMRALPLGPEYVCLQPEIRHEDAFLMQARPDIRHFADYLSDYADTAALVENLDLVVSVDTSVAHLAGALGKPVWILLPNDPDFRWLLGREDSPWYPSARLIRQPSFRDWDSVLARVRDDIIDLIDAEERA